MCLVLTATVRPKKVHLAWGLAGTFIVPYGIASAGASIINHTGWTVAAACFIIGADSFYAMWRRPTIGSSSG